jgi:galactokinase
MEQKKSRFALRVEKLVKDFVNYFKEEPEDVFSSPGRIELLGNHTDHNHGKVMVSSIDLNILAVAKKTDKNYFIYKTNGFPVMKVMLDDLDKREDEYNQSIGIIRGVLFKMKELGYNIGGVEVVTTTTIFKGAGVSSSAAFENLITKIVSYYYNEDKIQPFEEAQIGQFAESVYFNKPCGLLDQSGIAFGGVNYIDFKSTVEPEIISLNSTLKDFDFVLINTRDSHSQLTANYAEIKDDMFALASYFNKEVLREVDENEFFAKKEELIKKFSMRAFLRGKHFFEENHRVEKALKALQDGDQETFIKMVNESGESSFYQLKNCYVNNEEENLPKGLLLSKKIIKHGASRVHGGGFAGTMLAIVDKKETYDYIKEMRKIYGDNNVKKIALNKYGTRFVTKIKDIQ